eukprot:gene2976-3792_t
MKLDVNALRYMEKDAWRVLTAVEMGMKNHELVPAPLVESIAGLKHGGAYRQVQELLRNKLVHHDSKHYDGYRLTYMGYDFLALKSLLNRGVITGVGRQIGVGKESDIFEVVNEEGETLALKLHRLGRTSFRAVKNKRDYLKHRQNFNWLYLSRLAALKEFAFMRALGENGFPVPGAIEVNRHAVLMTLVKAHPLTQVRELAHPEKVFNQVSDLLVRMAEHGLIHCDLNEFNLMVNDQEEVTMIDFPQMVSCSHPNAEMYYERDQMCLKIFFARKFGLGSTGLVEDASPDESIMKVEVSDVAIAKQGTLDEALKASGFSKAEEKALEQVASRLWVL